MNTFIKRSFSELKKWTPNIPKCKLYFDINSFNSPHPIWDLKDASKIELTHYKPKTIRDHLANLNNKFFQKSCDIVTGYYQKKKNEKTYLKRLTLLETFSAVPGMIGGMMRHFAALRYIREDRGWIHNLLEESEKGRTHLFAILAITNPGLFERLFILLGQFIFIIYYSLMYIVSPTMAHRLVGYMNEEAIKIYSELIKDIDEGKLSEFAKKKPGLDEQQNWRLKPDSTFKDVLISIRADKVFIKEYNHHFADIPKNFPIEAKKFMTSFDEEEEKK